jgi:Outer membrane protein beta-barrel domain
MFIPKTTLRLLFTVIVLQTAASIRAEGNLIYADYKPFHFGFSLGLNAFDFGVTPSMQPINGKTYQVSVASLKPGFSVGIIGDLRLNDFFNLRFTPILHFGERNLSYKAIGEDLVYENNISSIAMCLPLFLKYSAERLDNARPYLVLGGGAYYDLGRDKANPILLKPLDFYTEFGVGCDIYFTFFKLSPELKLGLGLKDMLTPLNPKDAGLISEDDKKFTMALSKLTSRLFSLTFNFE